MAFVLQFALEIETAASRLVAILRTFQAFRGSDNEFATWVRDDAGNVDFTGATLSVTAYYYDGSAIRREFEATSSEAGRVEFAIAQTDAARLLPSGLYRLELRAVRAGVSRTVQVGILEVV
ncbi:hypothetical protein ASD78_12250 [Lysobacter sp. Root667]|uniref:hypothetical protein n=1 Tax=Lysobacter sp. Root667 TaxID=1736581 RepID=UPI0006FD1A63|nr:hypothetical protein [Lysobacter sp. Root667]KRA74258.1 hypothetical protein ASD78_12250 [Lysobacter sp. Root667]